MSRFAAAMVVGAAAGGAACGGIDPGTGTVEFSVEAETTIVDGLTPGTGDENVMDGWTVTYDKYLLTIGDLAIGQSADPGATLESPEVRTVDLAAIPATGLVLAAWDDVEAVRWDQVSYRSTVVDEATVRDDTVADADLAEMRAAGLSAWITGTAIKGDDSVDFDFRFDNSTRFESCGPEEGDKGFAVTDGGTTQAVATIHGDHYWFNAFPEGFEGNIVRLAEWINLVDEDDDGIATLAELDDSISAELFPPPTYSLGGAPVAIVNARAWLRAQHYTIGHFQGEGECAWAVE